MCITIWNLLPMTTVDPRRAPAAEAPRDSAVSAASVITLCSINCEPSDFYNVMSLAFAGPILPSVFFLYTRVQLTNTWILVLACPSIPALLAMFWYCFVTSCRCQFLNTACIFDEYVFLSCIPTLPATEDWKINSCLCWTSEMSHIAGAVLSERTSAGPQRCLL